MPATLRTMAVTEPRAYGAPRPADAAEPPATGRRSPGRVGYDDVVRLLDEGDVDGLADALIRLDEARRRALVPRIRAAVPACEEPDGAASSDERDRSAGAASDEQSERPGGDAHRDRHERLAGAACGEEREQRAGAASDELDEQPAEPAPQRADREAALLVAGAGCLPRATDIASWLRSRRFRAEPTGSTVAAVVRVLRAPGRPRLADVARELAARLRTRDTERGAWTLTAAALRSAELPPPLTEAFVLGWVRDLNAAGTRDVPVPASGPLADESVRFAARLGGDPWFDALSALALETPRAAAELGDAWPPALAVLAGTGRVDGAALVGLLVRRMGSGDRGAAMRPVLATWRRLAPSLDECAEHRAGLLAALAGSSSPVAGTAQRALRNLDDAGRLDAASVTAAAEAVLARGEKKLLRAQLAWLDRAAARHPEAAPALLTAVAARLGAAPGDDLADRSLRVLGHHPGAPEALRPVTDHLGGDLRRRADEMLGAISVPPAPRFPPAPIPYAPARLTPLTTLAELADEVDLLADGPLLPVPLERVLAATVAFTAADPDVPAAVFAALSPGSPLALLRGAPAGTAPDDAPPPQQMILHRIRELAGQLAARRLPPVLLATPATVDGHVEPARLLFRLAAAERDGWQPGRHDLAQALLRLPRAAEPAVHTAAARLRSPAGRHFAARLRQLDAPLPVVTGLALPDGLLAVGPPGPRAGDPACWPMVLPSHRELVAAHLLTSAPGAGAGTLTALARITGPFGPATALALAHGLTTAAADAVAAVAHLARHGGLDAALLGRELALLPGPHDRLVDALADLARGGAQHAVWAVLRTVVPALLRQDRPPAALPDLLALATATATAIGARADLPELSAVATRPERTRLKHEAARLARALSGRSEPPPETAR